MHVLQLGPYPPPEGGISRNMLAIRDEVIARGDRCTIVATTRSSQVGGEPDVYHPRSSLALLNLLASLKFDVLHLHIGGRVSSRVLALATAAAIFGRGRSVLTLHSGAYPLTEEARSATPNSIRGIIFRRFSQIIAVNDEIANVFRRYGIADKKIKVILPYAPSKPDENIAVPAALEDFQKAHSPLLLAVGGLEKEYDPLFQIAAMKDVLDEFPNAGLMIIGDGSQRSEVEQVVAASGYADNVCIPGNVEHAVTLHLIDNADVLLRTTLYDGDAISVREALFLDTPVIATDNGMRPEGVHVIPMRDADALLNAIRILVSKKTESKLKRVEDRSNIDAVVDLYTRVMDARPA